MAPELRWLFVLFVVGLQSTGHADTSEDALACARQPDDAARLACYDALFRKPPAAETLATGTQNTEAPTVVAPVPGAASTSQPVPTPQTPAVDGPQTDGVDDFGASDLEQQRENPGLPREITATIVSIQTLRSRARRFELDNGQVWQEKRFKSGLRLSAGDDVRIKSGSLGLHRLFGRGKVSTVVERVR